VAAGAAVVEFGLVVSASAVKCWIVIPASAQQTKQKRFFIFRLLLVSLYREKPFQTLGRACNRSIRDPHQPTRIFGACSCLVSLDQEFQARPAGRLNPSHDSRRRDDACDVRLWYIRVISLRCGNFVATGA